VHEHWDKVANKLTMTSTGSCIDFSNKEGRAVSESNVRKMDMWTGNSRDLLEFLCRKLDIGKAGEVMLEKRGGKNISTSG
jgi:hypothetical protein